VAGELLFDADDGSGRTLWITDGTEAGTRPLGATVVAVNPTNPAVLGPRVVFAANGAGAGNELWTLSCGDGTVDTDEVCDDGNLASDDCCSPLCRPVGVGAACPGLGCSDGACGPDGTCVLTLRPAGTACRPAAGDCDVAESCDGVSDMCPADALAAGVTCRAAAGLCDVAETCDGTSVACPPDGFQVGTVCRAVAGECDVAETCDGTSAACPADGFQVGTLCRAVAGECDVAETCDGTSAACPADGFQAGTLCRAAAGPCDVAETCSGTSAACPPDTFQTGTTCRAAAGDCDVAETCDGTSADCPADAFQTGTTCRAAAGDCDVAETCDGTGPACPPDAFLPATHVCRPGDGVCDPSESCTGFDAHCPADVVEDDSDADTVCDLIDNCPEDPNPDQLDGDTDGAGDACDVCTGVAQMAKPTFMLTKLLAPTGDDGLKLLGRMVVPGTPAFDPVVHGVRLLVTGAAGDAVVDAPIPGGAWSSAEKVGWTVNGKGTTWRYKHAGAAPTVVGGIQAITIKRTAADPTTVRFTVKGAAGSYPDAAAQLPLRATLVVEGPLGLHGQCADAVFAGPTAMCRSLSGGKTVRCR
jgi:cysteine-rich repeat protein/ELWxxDGT repeat protein